MDGASRKLQPVATGQETLRVRPDSRLNCDATVDSVFARVENDLDCIGVMAVRGVGQLGDMI